MTPARKRRLYLVLGIVVGVGIAGALALTAFKKNVMFFYDPSQVVAGQVKPGERFRLGGMVEKGSVQRTPGSLEIRFVVTDFQHHLPVKYDKVLPDLFREGQGVVAHGRIDQDGVFIADEVLAKHDEKYMPPQVARSLKKNGEAYVPKDGEKPGASAAPDASTTAPSAPPQTSLAPRASTMPQPSTAVQPSTAAQAPSTPSPAGT